MYFFLGLSFFIVGLPLLLVGIFSEKRAKTAQAWPSIQGVVLSSKVEQNYDNETGSATTSFEPVVEYQYELMGQSLTGKRISYGANSFNYKKAAEIVALYPAGSKVKVYYNPEKVSDCTLETTSRGGKVFRIIGFILVPVAFILFALGSVID